MKTRILMAALAALLITAQAKAEQSYCHLSGDALSKKLQEFLPGQWHVHNTFGTLSFNGITMPLPSGNDSVANITIGADGLQINDLPAVGPYDLRIIEDARFTLDLPSRQIMEDGKAMFGDQPSLLSGEEIRVLACGEKTPQLHAKGKFKDPEGMIDFDLYLFVVNETTMYGVVRGEMKKMGGVAKRLTHFRKL
ncbi:hypothetical protein [Cohaesibacter gelatinilyticus]|uniref:THAP4-like heme-binding beta-barrel domain-containing protein n=1 Tax=Cohaesibacter gelatinilyticus TaxID=372072 RepID=A0A285PD32_9HYPH|nr:hypothetical protein [Cohaesibacter gelatinilyticus]SNZ19660.1 hypothetical protein SAMN06265368_2750 [Cohaesibacter gelatinilyticus]HAT84750.1 hypothetical protein [Hyphomicrobiales bacterium]